MTQKPPPKKPPEKSGASTVAPTAPDAAVKKPPTAPVVHKPLGQGPAARKPADLMRVGKGGVSIGGGVKAGVSPATDHRGQAKSAAPPKSENIEDTALALFKDATVDPPMLFQDFLEKIEPSLALGGTSAALLKDFANIDVTAERVAQTLRSNPYYQHHFQRVVTAMSRRPDPPPLDAAVVLLGMQNSRNLIIALQMQRSINHAHPEYDKDGKLRISPKDVLKYALKTEEIHVSLKAQYADLGFAAGLVYDYLVALANKHAPEPKKVALYIDHLYMHCLKSAYVAREMALQMPTTGFGKFTFSAALLHDVGKAAMAILSLDYLAFVEEAQKKDLPRAVRLFAETERFGTNHALLGALVCHSFRIFRPIERVILHHHEPFVMKESHRNLHALTSLVCLSTNVASNFKKAERDDDPVLKLWKGPEISDFAVNMRQVMTAVQRVI